MAGLLRQLDGARLHARVVDDLLTRGAYLVIGPFGRGDGTGTFDLQTRVETAAGGDECGRKLQIDDIGGFRVADVETVNGVTDQFDETGFSVFG